MKKMILLFGLALWMAPAAAQQSSPGSAPTGTYRLTLEQCIDYAMGNSYTRAANLLDQETAMLNLKQSKLNRYPNLSGSAGESMRHSKSSGSYTNSQGEVISGGSSVNWSGSVGVSTGVTLFQGGSLKKNVDLSRMQLRQTGVRNRQADNTLVMNILNSYFNILGYDELLRYQESLIGENQQQVELGKVRRQAGSILQSDYLMLESQLATNLNSITDTRINLDNELLALKTLLSMSPDADLQVVSPDTTRFASMTSIPDQNYFMQNAVEATPDFELLDYSVTLAEQNLKISKSSLWPSLSASGGMNTSWGKLNDFGSQLEDNFSQNLGLSLSIPIFNRSQNRINVERNRITLQQAEYERAQGELTLRQTLLQAYRNLHSALSRYNTYTVREEAYGETLRVYNMQFETGSITAVELLQQQNNYINVMYDYVQSKYNFMLRRKILDVYMGHDITM